MSGLDLPGWVTVWPFVQAFLLTVVVWASIGIYGCYYVIRSLARYDGTSYEVECQLAAHPDGPTPRALPKSARDLPFLGLLLFGWLGPLAVVALLVLAVVGMRWVKVRTLVVVHLLYTRAIRWHPNA